MAIGLEDYTADMGTRRTLEGKESLYARSRMVNACKAAGIQAIDSVAAKYRKDGKQEVNAKYAAMVESLDDAAEAILRAQILIGEGPAPGRNGAPKS